MAWTVALQRKHGRGLEFPENIAEQVGSGSLVIEMDVDTRDEEYMEYSEGSKYVFYKDQK